MPSITSANDPMTSAVRPKSRRVMAADTNAGSIVPTEYSVCAVRTAAPLHAKVVKPRIASIARSRREVALSRSLVREVT